MEFYERIGVADQIRWFDQMNFIEPGGRISVMKSSPLPAPLHTAPSFFNFPFLSAADKLSISRALVPLTLTAQRDNGKSFQHWLDRHGQTQNAIERFWQPILVSALSEELDLISVSAAAQVVRESMKSPAARHMGVPTVPLTDLYNAAGDYIRARGGDAPFPRARRRIHRKCSRHPTAVPQSGVTRQNTSGRRTSVRETRLANFDFLILALPFDALDRVLPNTPESAPLREKITHFENSPITGIHLWFDRQISDLDHAVLLDRTIQWMFHKSRLQTRGRAALQGRASIAENGASAPEGSYIELVVSSSKTLIDKSRAEIVDLALAEVREFFPAARDANSREIHRDQRSERHLLAAPRHRRPPSEPPPPHGPASSSPETGPPPAGPPPWKAPSAADTSPPKPSPAPPEQICDSSHPTSPPPASCASSREVEPD